MNNMVSNDVSDYIVLFSNKRHCKEELKIFFARMRNSVSLNFVQLLLSYQ
jgi:hypothetical protein